MKNRTTAALLQEMERTRAETLELFSSTEPALSYAYGPGKWTVRHLLHHLADSEVVLYERLCRILAEPARTQQAFEEGLWATALDYPSRPMEISSDLYAAVRRANVHLAERHYERDGARMWTHSAMGERTVRQEFDKVAEHNAHHLEQIRAALARRQGP